MHGTTTRQSNVSIIFQPNNKVQNFTNHNCEEVSYCAVCCYKPKSESKKLKPQGRVSPEVAPAAASCCCGAWPRLHDVQGHDCSPHLQAAVASLFITRSSYSIPGPILICPLSQENTILSKRKPQQASAGSSQQKCANERRGRSSRQATALISTAASNLRIYSSTASHTHTHTTAAAVRAACVRTYAGAPARYNRETVSID